jgi:hypothetical protein
MLKCSPRKEKKTKVTGSLRKQTKKQTKPAKKLEKEKKLTLALSHHPPQLNHLIGEVILMMAKCAYALSLSHA